MINFFRKLLKKDEIDEATQENWIEGMEKETTELGNVWLDTYLYLDEKKTIVYYFDFELSRIIEIISTYDSSKVKEEYIDECIVEFIRNKKVRSDYLEKSPKLPDSTKISNNSKIVSMVNHDGILVVATTNRVYQLTSDNILVPIKFKMEESKND